MKPLDFLKFSKPDDFLVTLTIISMVFIVTFLYYPTNKHFGLKYVISTILVSLPYFTLFIVYFSWHLIKNLSIMLQISFYLTLFISYIFSSTNVLTFLQALFALVLLSQI